MTASKIDIENILKTLGSKNIESLKAEDFDQFQYQGFDPMRIVASLAVVKKDKNVKDEELVDDICKMVAIGMIKGSVNDHNLTKMSDEGKKEINDLITKYGVQKGGGRGKSATVITFPRVMATFPDIAVRMVAIIGPKEFRGGPMLSTRLPSYLQVQVFPSVIPRDAEGPLKSFLLTAALCYSIDQTIQISKIENPDVKAVSSTQSNFIAVGHASPMAQSATRARVFKQLSIAEDYESIASVVSDYKSKVDPSIYIPSKDEVVVAMSHVK